MILVSRKFLVTLSLAAIAATAQSAVIEGFENTSNPGSWSANQGPDQTVNATNPPDVPIYSALHTSEGTHSGEFVTTWTLPGTSSATNPYVDDGPSLFWAIRYNILGPGSLPGNQVSNTSGILTAQFYNDNSYPVNVSLVLDSSASSQLERGPLVEVAANSQTTYTWNLASIPPTGFDGGDGQLSGMFSRLKSLLVYTDTPPSSGDFRLFVDNISVTNPGIDLTPPAVPRLLSVRQGASPGHLEVNWAPNTDPDLGGYRIYLASDSNFGSPTSNHLTFPITPVATASASAVSADITVPFGQNAYIGLTAIDITAPAPNESDTGLILGARLDSSGTQPSDLVVLGGNAFLPGDTGFTANSYNQAIVYNGQALGDLGRTYASAASDAIDSGDTPLFPSETGVILWSTMLDGNQSLGGLVSEQSLNAIENCITNGGHVILSGTGLAEDLASHSPSSQAFLANVLKASLVTGNAANAAIDGTDNLLSAGSWNTALNPLVNTVAYSTSENDLLTGTNGGYITALYHGIPRSTGGAAVEADKRTLLFGFALESAGSSDGASAGRTLRRDLFGASINYLTVFTAAQDWTLYN